MMNACSKQHEAGLRWLLIPVILLMPAIFVADVATGYRFGLSDLYCIVALMMLRLAGARPARAVIAIGVLLTLASAVDAPDAAALVRAAIAIALLGTVFVLIRRGRRAALPARAGWNAPDKASRPEVPAPLLDELRQPLSVLLSDARASSRWLTRDQPDLPEALLCAQRIVVNATRAGEMISAIGRRGIGDISGTF